MKSAPGWVTASVHYLCLWRLWLTSTWETSVVTCQGYITQVPGARTMSCRCKHIQLLKTDMPWYGSRFTSRLRARVILGQILSIVTCWNPHKCQSVLRCQTCLPLGHRGHLETEDRGALGEDSLVQNPCVHTSEFTRVDPDWSRFWISLNTPNPVWLWLILFLFRKWLETDG